MMAMALKKATKGDTISQPVMAGFGFGLTSGVITTLGLIIGLETGTGSPVAVLGGILTIAVADALSDALGIHISQESDKRNPPANVWASTISTFIIKFVVALTFAIPVIMLPLDLAITICIVWGLSIISALSYYVAKRQNENPLAVIGEHLSIAVIVLLVAALVGNFVATNFGNK